MKSLGSFHITIACKHFFFSYNISSYNRSIFVQALRNCSLVYTPTDALPTLQRTQMWVEVKNNGRRSWAHSLAHNTLRGIRACWSSGMGQKKVDKLHSLTRAYTQPTQGG
jgi:hypothetical protein